MPIPRRRATLHAGKLRGAHAVHHVDAVARRDVELERVALLAHDAARGEVGDRTLGRGVTACIDLSDGLADAVRQLATASGTGAEVRREQLPIDDAARRWAEWSGRDAIAMTLAGGEDYELLFAVSPRTRSRLKHVQRRVSDVAVTPIGRLTSDRALVLTRNGRTEALPSGFEHF